MKKIAQIAIQLFMVILIPGCAFSGQDTTKAERKSFDISTSVDIILELIRTNTVCDVLENPRLLDVDILLRNFSPAEIAFEAEVLSCTLPVLVHFYQEDPNASFIEEVATLCENTVKVVTIPAKRYFKLAEIAQIDNYPAFIVIRDRQEKGRIEGESTLNQLQALIKDSIPV